MVVVCIYTEVLCVTERPAVCVDADDSLLCAMRRLRETRVHRVLVIDSDTGNAVHVLTQRSILEFLASRVCITLCLSSLSEFSSARKHFGAYVQIIKFIRHRNKVYNITVHKNYISFGWTDRRQLCTYVCP